MPRLPCEHILIFVCGVLLSLNEWSRRLKTHCTGSPWASCADTLRFWLICSWRVGRTLVRAQAMTIQSKSLNCYHRHLISLLNIISDCKLRTRPSLPTNADSDLLIVLARDPDIQRRSLKHSYLSVISMNVTRQKCLWKIASKRSVGISTQQSSWILPPPFGFHPCSGSLSGALPIFPSLNSRKHTAQ